MAAKGGLGRTLADIRADLERGHDGPPPSVRLLDDLERVLEGAEPRGIEYAPLTPGEAWGLLLEMPPERRLRWLGNVLAEGRNGSACEELDHRGRMHELARLRRSILPTQERVEALCEVMHDAYEAAAVSAGWETQERSRKPWADVPEANKATMRRAVLELLMELARYHLPADESRLLLSREVLEHNPGDIVARLKNANERMAAEEGARHG